jgi:hypothetical protein
VIGKLDINGRIDHDAKFSKFDFGIELKLDSPRNLLMVDIRSWVYEMASMDDFVTFPVVGNGGIGLVVPKRLLR